MIKYYNLHDQIYMRVVNPTQVFDRLIMFECGPLNNLDLDIIIAPFKFDKKQFKEKNGFYSNDNTFYTFHRHKLSFWNILIENIDKTKTTILFDGDPWFSTELLLMLILEPLFVYKMSKKGGLVLHSSALSLNGVGCLFTGNTGIGKTSILLKLLDTPSSEYYADDQTFIINNKIHAYPVPIGFRQHLVERNNVVISKRNEAILEIHAIINGLTGYYPNLTQRISVDDIKFKSGQFVVPGDVVPLKKVFILNKTNEEPSIERIAGDVAYPRILVANNKNEDKLKLLYKLIENHDLKLAKTFWCCFETNLKTLVNNQEIEFYLVNLNKSYDYDPVLNQIKKVVNND